MLEPPYATCSGVDVIGPVSGSSPNWAQSAFLDRGRKHTSGMTTAELGNQGLQGWYNTEHVTTERKLTRRLEGPNSYSYAEPCIHGAHSTYYTRRDICQENAEAYRPTIKMVKPLEHVDRPVGKRFIPEPHGPPPRLHSRTVREQPPSSTLPEPGMPRLSRPTGATILRESDQELSYERAFGRKIRVGHDTYRGLGRAGDMSLSYGPARRPEDDPVFFKTLKDSPTFTRFVASLPKPKTSPHERRVAAMQRTRQAEVSAERQLVATLNLPVADDDV